MNEVQRSRYDGIFDNCYYNGGQSKKNIPKDASFGYDDYKLITQQSGQTLKKIARSCYPDDSDIERDYPIVPSIDDVYAGLFLEIFPTEEMNRPASHLKLRKKDDGKENPILHNPTNSGKHCLTVFKEKNRPYTVNDRDDYPIANVYYYELEERVHDELGLIDIYRSDFAYRTACDAYKHLLNNMPSSSGGGNRIGGSDKYVPIKSAPPESRVNYFADYVSWIDRFGWMSNPFANIQVAEDASETHQSESNTKSWFSQQPKTTIPSKEGGGDFHKQYERMGERAFAGGAQGEVWRARRRCSLDPLTSANYYSNEKDMKSQSKERGDNEKESSAEPDLAAKTPCDESQELIMKRLKVENGLEFLKSGLREVYFGKIIAEEKESAHFLFTKYIDHFFREGSDPFLQNGSFGESLELWIVFEYAGPSLRSILYTPVNSGGFIIYQHSEFWRKLRTDAHDSSVSQMSTAVVAFVGIPNRSDGKCEDNDEGGQPKDLYHNNHTSECRNFSLFGGKVLMRESLRQLLSSVAFLHKRGILHRDIKPSNIMCMGAKDVTGKIGETFSVDDSIDCVLGDFSSAYDSAKDGFEEEMYMNGPSSAEQTDNYAPPEVLFGPGIPFDIEMPMSYDSWSIGVVILEMLLGTPNVFSVDQRTTAILSNRLSKEGASPEDIQRALYLAGLSQFCIYVPTTDDMKRWPMRAGDPLAEVKIVKATCTMEDFHNALRARDPLGLGFDNSYDPLLELVSELLAWNPSDRITPARALEHKYFHPEKDTDDDLDISNSSGDVSVDPPSDQALTTINNALYPQVLDPKTSLMVEKSAVTEFVCPKCGKSFGDWKSCHTHARARRHSKFCDFDRTALPPCFNAHPMLPTHPNYGYCDIQGRRPTIEDFHSIQLDNERVQYYGVFDGHLGNKASKYASSYMYTKLMGRLNGLINDVHNDETWKLEVRSELFQSFQDLHEDFLKEAVAGSASGVMNKSGTTATILLVAEEAIIVANIGDSRAVLSASSSALPLTVDHIASNTEERRRIESRGGHVSSSGGVDRVNGTLAVTRSIGDVPFMGLLSRTPHVWLATKDDVRSLCNGESNEGNYRSLSGVPCFVVLASDGLWDVVSNQEAVDMVMDVLQNYDLHSINDEVSLKDEGAYQLAAQRLTQEAYVRGSMDNIGVCVVAIDY